MQSSAAEKVVRNYCDRFPGQLIALTQLLDSNQSGAAENAKAKLQHVAQEAHRMAGAAHCMGFGFVGAEFMQIEKEAERVLESDEAPDAGLTHISEKLENIVRFRRHVRVENSRLLRRRDDDIEFVDDIPVVTDKELFASQRVLFADDDAAVRALMRALLIDIGIGEVRIVRSGEEALGVAHSFDPTILISDWQMQPMDGLELLTRIRTGSTNLSSNTRIIFLTSRNGVKEVRQVIRRGVDHFLIKPFTQDIIARAIAKVMKRD